MRVLFLCTLNAVRSPMAEALARRYYPEHEFHSAGLIAGPTDYFAVEVMNEVGIDISERKTRSFENLKHKNFDLVICLADESANEFKPIIEKHKLKAEFWNDIPHPGEMSGSRMMKIFNYREIRDKIKAKLRKANFSN